MNAISTTVLLALAFAFAASEHSSVAGRVSRPGVGRVFNASAGRLFGRGAQQAPALLEQGFTISSPSEVLATIRAGCARCDWSAPGREAAQLIVTLDGRYSQHLMLVRGAEPADYRVMLGRFDAGPHKIRVTQDERGSARDIGRSTVVLVETTPIRDDSSDALALSMAPIVHARANTIERFTDVPILMWYEIVPTSRGRQIRYSVIFTNEDGGTPTDRLMATWGRTTDIEYVYGVELEGATNKTVGEEYQGPEHKILPFAGRRESGHPLLWVATDNNMVKDAGETTIRYAPAPTMFDLTVKSREVVMDENPWTYRVMAAEMIREGKIVPNAAPGSQTIPDPRRFAFVEACTDLENAAVTFSVRARSADGSRWYDADHGRPDFRITRTGCVRGAVSVPEGARLEAVRFRAHTKPRKPDEPATAPGRVRLTRVNTVFRLRDDYTPGGSVLSWTGDQSLALDRGGYVIDIK